jgi:putative phosphoesterase
MTRIGVVADTHCPEFLDRLPPELLDRLQGVDLILHAGDIGGAGASVTLRQLSEIAPVEAVQGDHDHAVSDIPLRRELTIAGQRIGLIHGNRSRLIEEPVTFLGTVTLGAVWPLPGLSGWLRQQFPNADVIVYGHTHQAAIQHADGKLLFNPGPIYTVNADEVRRRLARGPNWFEWCWLQVIRHRRDGPGCSMGLLEIDEQGVRATIHRL